MAAKPEDFRVSELLTKGSKAIDNTRDKKTGSIMVAYHEKGSIEVIQFHPMNGHLLPNNIFIEFVDDESYNQSMKNRVVSCKIFP